MCKLYVSFTGRRGPRLETGGGWRRTRVRRERRWPSFIIWRWAGPALDGWTPCPWRAHPLLLPPQRRRHTVISMSRRPANPGLLAHAVVPARRRPNGRRSEPARSRLARAPRRALVDPPDGPNRLRRAAVARLGRVPVSPLAARAHAARRRANGLRRAGADGDGKLLR
jgi:hypothetical protein